jgi:hypothetical protein
MKKIILEEDLWSLIDDLSNEIYRKLDDPLYSTETSRMLLVGHREMLDKVIEGMVELSRIEKEEDE